MAGAGVRDRLAERTDAELVELAWERREAFGVLYDRYVVAVYHYCLRRAGNAAEAEDLTSTVFLRAIERIETVRPEAFRGWLFAVTRTVVIDRFRRGPAPHADLDATAESAIDPAPGPEDAALRHAGEQTVTAMLADLPPDQRTAMELRLAGFTVRETAGAMDRSPAAVKMLHHRAARTLRARIQRIVQSNEGDR